MAIVMSSNSCSLSINYCDHFICKNVQLITLQSRQHLASILQNYRRQPCKPGHFDTIRLGSPPTFQTMQEHYFAFALSSRNLIVLCAR